MVEAHLGVRRLHRTTRSLSLTDEGQRFLETTQPALAALDRALGQACESKHEIAGPLRIVGPRSSFVAILMPVLDGFCRLHPQVQPEVPLMICAAPSCLERHGAPRSLDDLANHRCSVFRHPSTGPVANLSPAGSPAR